MSERVDKPGLVERLWAAADGTVCLLSTSVEPPMYAISLVRGARVLRERRLYARATAHMVAQSWAESVA
jgi:hypothetical protein